MSQKSIRLESTVRHSRLMPNSSNLLSVFSAFTRVLLRPPCTLR
eukprot:NODE_20173_length_167_cov_10.423729_g19259_i0.p1 GENE.NODE_20173_length_167_cov_10.423729_g19259_i0~~NODE_20173_length_167_cov_10.423729_g19259_i0.p1  ORF type:complete len:52 (-),score=0.31 NODE_20173_length_167_cov_10.423729_g19259_i0:10-141(-)